MQLKPLSFREFDLSEARGIEAPFGLGANFWLSQSLLIKTCDSRIDVLTRVLVARLALRIERGVVNETHPCVYGGGSYGGDASYPRTSCEQYRGQHHRP